MTDTESTNWGAYPSASDPILFDSRGARRTASLFHETTKDQQKAPLFTLRDYHKPGLPSAYLLYMESETEYDAAMKLVGSMGHWRQLMAKPWFMHGDPERGFFGLDQWRKDMAMRDANQAMLVLRGRVTDGDAKAAQFLINYATKGAIAGGKDQPAKKPKLKAATKDNKIADLTELKKKLSAVPSGEAQ